MDGRRWRIEGGFGLDRLTASAVTIGDPAPGRCAVELRAWSLNFRDLLMARGQYDPRLALPYVPLSDAVGVVVAVGDGVTRVAVGDRVCPTFSPGWLAGPPTVDATRVTRGGPIPGVLSTCVDLDAGELVHPPAHLTDVEAATLPCAGVTAWHAVVEVGRVCPGQVVLVLGTGGVSMFAAQLARACGARVAAVTTSPHKVDALRAVGVEHVVTGDERWGRAIRRWSDGGVDLVVEVGGAGTFEQSLDAVRVGGTVAVIGNVAGSREPISVLPILMRQIRCQGVFVGSRATFEALARGYADRPVVDTALPFDQAPAAFARLASGAHVGKVCLS